MANFTQKRQKIQGNQTNIGGNQVIQNIILVGHFLSLAQAEDLFPKDLNNVDAQSIAEAFDKGFNQHLSNELINATAEAGRMLSPILKKFAPKDEFFVVPLDQVITELVSNLGNYFTERNYWRAYSHVGRVNDTIAGSFLQVRGVLLDATNKVFKSKDATITSFWMIDIPNNRISSMGKEARIYNGLNPANLNILTYHELQLLLTGIIIDTIKFCSTTSNHTNYWNGVVDMLNTNIKNNKRQK